MKKITVHELKDKLNDYLVIDVRCPTDHKSERIESAYLIPVSDISVDKLPKKDTPVVIHCYSGKLSIEACKKLQTEDPSLEVYSLEGGITAWKGAGLPTKKSKKFVIGVVRQTQIGVGLFIFIGVIFGTYINPMFYMVSGFFGLGLVFAGLTGWCGMTKLLACMPWNK